MTRKKNRKKKDTALPLPQGETKSEILSERPVNIPDFLFDSVYQVVTWVCIALSIGGLFYFASKSSGRGVLWSVVCLVCFVAIMIGVMADRHFFRSANTSASAIIGAEEGGSNTVAKPVESDLEKSLRTSLARIWV